MYVIYLWLMKQKRTDNQKTGILLLSQVSDNAVFRVFGGEPRPKGVA